MTFRFPCYRDFKFQLGSLDALAEGIEVSIRHFLKDVESAGNTSKFISEASRRYGVKVDSLDPSALQIHAAQLYVVGVHQGFEEFLVAIKKQHPDGKAWDFNGDDDRLTKTLRAVGGKPTLEFEVCQHYRLVRNAFVHPEARNKLAENEKGLKKLREKVVGISTYSRLDAPNGFKKLGFDDFILYSRASKRLAEDLCLVGKPTEEQMVTLVREYAHSSGEQARLINKPMRLRAKLAGFLRTQYSLEPYEAGTIAAKAI